jgi:hypothetical protein
MSNSILKNVLLLMGLVTVLFVGYYIYSQIGSDLISTQDTEAEYSKMLLNTQVFIERREELSRIKIDTGFFEDQSFRSLQSNSDPIKQINVGRTDPFASAGSSQ